MYFGFNLFVDWDTAGLVFCCFGLVLFVDCLRLACVVGLWIGFWLWALDCAAGFVLALFVGL